MCTLRKYGLETGARELMCTQEDLSCDSSKRVNLFVIKIIQYSRKTRGGARTPSDVKICQHVRFVRVKRFSCCTTIDFWVLEEHVLTFCPHKIFLDTAPIKPYEDCMTSGFITARTRYVVGSFSYLMGGELLFARFRRENWLDWQCRSTTV